MWLKSDIYIKSNKFQTLFMKIIYIYNCIEAKVYYRNCRATLQ